MFFDSFNDNNNQVIDQDIFCFHWDIWIANTKKKVDIYPYALSQKVLLSHEYIEINKTQ